MAGKRFNSRRQERYREVIEKNLNLIEVGFLSSSIYCFIMREHFSLEQKKKPFIFFSFLEVLLLLFSG